jgi:negative regulator of flagellin synthesis FlgM
MPPIELGPHSLRPTRVVGATEARNVPGPVANDTARAHASPNSAVVRSTALDPGEVPIDSDRVLMIRKAIQSGSYPVVPARIADAIIAAGLLLRSPRS